VKIPKMASLILAHDMDAELKGLNEFPGAHPPVAPIFWAFRVMVGVGSLMLAVAWWGAWMLWRQRKEGAHPDGRVKLPRPLLWTLAGMTFSGWLATLAGWYVTEIGRQPFVVYGHLRTADVATQIAPPMIALTLTAYLIVYGLLLITYVGVLKYMAEHPFKHAPEAPAGAALGKAGV
jgi:cytochrome bd ubiquinol oxidase subunit I